MPPTTRQAPPFERRRAHVEAMIAAREPLTRLEGAIEQSDLTQDQKAALWLLAWSTQEPEALRNNLEATLALMATS